MVVCRVRRRTSGPERSAPLRSGGAVMRFDLGGQVAECGLECAQEAKDGVPADASASALDLGYVGGVDGEPCCELLLRDACAFA